MKKLFSYIRLSEWYDSKVPFMLAALMLFYYVDLEQYGASQFLVRFICYGLYVSMFLAFSYVINDFSDIEVDKLAGKHKIICELTKPVIISSMVLMASLGIIPTLFLVQNKIGYILMTAFIYFSGAAYSIHAFRFKEKGVIGLLECSIAQRCFPLFPLFFIVRIPMIFFLTLQMISFVNGVRYLLIHQNIDYENDWKSGVVTIATSGKLNYKLLIKISLAIETVLVLGVFIQISLISKLVIAVGIIYLIFENIIAIVIIKYIQADWFSSFICVPYEDLYNIFIPVFLALLLSIEYPMLLICVIILAVMVFNSFKGKWAFVNIFIKSKIRKKQ